MKSQEQVHIQNSPTQLEISQIVNQIDKPGQITNISIEQENSKGRFIPNLLLAHKLHSKIDSNNNTLLAHMCAANSPLLPIYIQSLPYNDQVITQKNSFGNSPVEIAGLYCRKKIVNLLKSKGAIDNGGIDYWAIRGGNLQNWSGNVPKDKKQLIHWAAYNDLPQVLHAYYESGENMQQFDLNGSTPIQIALVNKSYKAFEFLLSIGIPINEQKVRDMKSLSLNKIYDDYTKKSQLKRFTIVFFLLYLSLHFFLYPEIFTLLCLTPLLIQYLALFFCNNPTIKSDQTERIYHFQSALFNKRVQWGSNHHNYLLFNLGCGIVGIICVTSTQINTYLRAIVYLILLITTIAFWVNTLIEIYSISMNLTNFQLFNTDKVKHLWRKIQVVQQHKLVYHVLKNPFDLGFSSNWKQYFGRI